MPFHYCAPFVFYRNMKSKDVCIKFRHEITSTRAQNTTYVIDKVCMIVSRLLKIYLKRIFTRTFYQSLSDHCKTGQHLKYLKLLILLDPESHSVKWTILGILEVIYVLGLEMISIYKKIALTGYNN